MMEKMDSLECADSELAQCEAEVGTLLQIISEINMKMGALKIPCDQKNYEAQLQAYKSASDLNASPRAPQISPGTHVGSTSVKSVTKKHSGEYEGSSGEIWTKLQQVLSTLESSASRGRKLVAPHHQADDKTQEEHITAARDTWVQAIQVLEEIERELGISYASALPAEGHRKDAASLGKQNREPRSGLQKRQQEQKKMEEAIVEMEQEKKLLREKLDKLKNKWLVTASYFRPRSPSLSYSRSPSRPPCASQRIPASPFISRRMSVSPPGSPCGPRRPSSGSSVLETETENLLRSRDRLKAKNVCLTAALQRRKKESEQISMALIRQEAACSALYKVLSYSEACEEAYSELLSMYEARKQPNAALADVSIPELNEESFCTAVVTQSSLSTEEIEEKIGVIKQRIGRLKRDRAAVCVPKKTRPAQGKFCPDTHKLAGTRRLNFVFSNNSKEDKTASVRKEMSELPGLVRSKEKERRSLDFLLVVHRCQESALAQSQQAELDERKAEQQRIKEYQAVPEGGAGMRRDRSLVKRLRTARHREQALKRKVTSLRQLLDTAMSDCSTHRRANKDARLFFFNKYSTFIYLL